MFADFNHGKKKYTDQILKEYWNKIYTYSFLFLCYKDDVLHCQKFKSLILELCWNSIQQFLYLFGINFMTVCSIIFC